MQLYAGHFPEAANTVPPRHRQMPYRRFLRLVAARLQATFDDAAFPYESPDEFIADLERRRGQLARAQRPPRRPVRRAAAIAPCADIRLSHCDARHSPARARAPARDRRGAARGEMARARRRRTRAASRRRARAARIAARCAGVRRPAHARDVPDDRPLPPQVRPRFGRAVHRQHGARPRRRVIGACCSRAGAIWDRRAPTCRSTSRRCSRRPRTSSARRRSWTS